MFSELSNEKFFRLGTTPLNWLPFNNSASSFERLPKEDGMLPLNWLLDSISSCSRLEKLPKEDGMLPLSWLYDRFSTRILLGDKLPNSEGMLPLSWLFCKNMYDKLDRLPSSGGMLPLSWLLFSHRSDR